MSLEKSNLNLCDVKATTLTSFFVLTFALAWGIVSVMVLFPEFVTKIFGEISGTNPLFILAVYAPALAVFFLVFKTAGIKGLKTYLSRLFLWRAPWWGYALIVIGIPLIFYVGAYAKGTLFTEVFPASAGYSLLVAIGFMLIIGPVEEFGWRGFALPLLQRKMAPIFASIVLGIIWGIWHLPAFFLSGTPHSAWSFAPFFIAAITISIIMTLFSIPREAVSC